MSIPFNVGKEFTTFTHREKASAHQFSFKDKVGVGMINPTKQTADVNSFVSSKFIESYNL